MFKSKTIMQGDNPNQQYIIQEATGAPQENIVSPILCNIYLTLLDNFIKTEIIDKYTKGKTATVNPEYIKLMNKKRTKSYSKLPTENKKKIDQNLLKEAKLRGIRHTLIDDQFTRIRYIRYADDFIVGVRAPKNTTLEIKQKITNFLQSHLHLTVNQDKTKLTDTYSEKAHFLGMTIHNIPTHQLKIRKAGHIEKIKRNRTRVINRLKRAQMRKEKETRDNLLKHLRAYSKKAIDEGNLKNRKAELSKAIQTLVDPTLLQNSNRSITRNVIKALVEASNSSMDSRLAELIGQINRQLYSSEESDPSTANTHSLTQADQGPKPQANLTKIYIGEKIREAVAKLDL